PIEGRPEIEAAHGAAAGARRRRRRGGVRVRSVDAGGERGRRRTPRDAGGRAAALADEVPRGAGAEGRRGAFVRGDPEHPAAADPDAEDPRRPRARDAARDHREPGADGVGRQADAVNEQPIHELSSLRDVRPPPALVARVMTRLAEPRVLTMWQWLRR